MSKRNRHSKRRTPRRPPASGRKPVCKLTPGDIANSADELLAYHRQFQPFFSRREQRDWSWLYLCGQLSNLERKTMEAIVLALIGPDPNAVRTAQHFLGDGPWEILPLVEHAQSLVADWLGEPEGVVIVDGSGFAKQGKHSVGVIRQYCGHLGKIANCQQGVFLVYASRHGYAFLDQRLYLPEAWFGETYQERWQVCGIPESVSFRTEPQLGVAMITELVERAVVPFRWVTADEGYGKSPVFLEGIEALGKWYLAEVPSDTRVWLRTPAVESPGRGLSGHMRTRSRVKLSAPRPQELREMVAQLPKASWLRRVIKEGSKGPIVAEFAMVRVTPVRDELPGPRSWAIFRRNLGPQPEVKFYLSNAPVTCPRQEFVRLSGMRWPVETAIEEGRGEVGMDHYETRTWRGWHHHMTHSILAHLFLVRLLLMFQKKSGHHPGPSPSTDRTGDRRRSGWSVGYSCHPPVSSTSQSCRLPVPSQADSFSLRQKVNRLTQPLNFPAISDFS